MATSPLTQESDLTSFTILSNGKEIPATYKVVSLKTVHELNRIAAAEIVLLDGDTSTQNFKVADSSTFIPGSEIEIKLGYHSKNDTVFKGLVMKQHIKISHGEGSQLHIICKDKALKMTVTKKNRMYSKTTDSGIMQSLINSSGLSSEVLETTILHEEVVQDATTDWHFLINRAAIYGLVVHTDNGKVVVAKPKVSDSAVLEVEYGRDINECNITLDARFQYAEVKARSQAFNSQDFIEAISKEPIVNKQGNITGKKLSKVLDAKSYLLHLPDGMTKEEVQYCADAFLLKSRLSRYKGTITFQGSAKVKPNNLLTVKGLGKRFNGDAFISGVTHNMAEGQWLTTVRVGLDAL